jgi:hypothetical protein
MEKWLVFSRNVMHGDKCAGQVEIAYALSDDPNTKQEVIVPVADSRLVVFFPTIVETHLGFLIQGPYRTTPSRDNIPKDDQWNRYLISETSILVQQSLAILRDRGFLSVSVLNAMPLEREKFQGLLPLARLEHMCMPIFKGVKDSLLNDNLLPAYSSGFASGKNVKIARTDALRKLFSPSQVAQLYNSPADLFWLTEEITRDKTAQLRQYLIAELGINEMDTDSLVSRFTEDFIKKQSDEWVARFYAFLLDQPALWRTGGFKLKPILRLESGKHVTLLDDAGHIQAFLPTEGQSGFPQVKRSLVQDALALKFLKQLGLTAPDPVDDVIFHVLPKFVQPGSATPSIAEYRELFGRILAAFQTDSTSQREKLVSKLKQTPFVRCRNAATGKIEYQLPEAVYFATDKLTTLFNGIPVIWLLDDQFESHRGELPRKLLEACSVRDYLRRVPVDESLSYEQKLELRKSKGAIKCSWDNAIGFDVVGLRAALEHIATLSLKEALPAAQNLWQVLIDTLREGRETYFYGSYNWGYVQSSWTAHFPAAFVNSLRHISWLPTADGSLDSPTNLRFSQLDASFLTQPNVIIQELLGFKPEVIKQLAIEAGVDLETIDLLKKHDITAEKLLQMLQQAGMEAKPTPLVSDESTPNRDSQTNSSKSSDDPSQSATGTSLDQQSGTNSTRAGQDFKPFSNKQNESIRQPQAGEFVTYIYTHPDNGDARDDGDIAENSEQRIKDGLRGVEAVLEYERKAGRIPEQMPQTHEGYDVISRNISSHVERYIEVKTPGSKWGSRGVTLSHPQFKAAQTHEENYWLYVVEDVGKPSQRIYRIQNPAVKTKYFAFDHGWRELAELDASK